MINLREKAQDLVAHLHIDGFGGFKFPDSRVCDYGTAHYACISDVIPDTFDLDGDASDYFDWAQYDCDLAMKIKDHFKSDGEHVEMVRPHEAHKRDADFPQSGSVIVIRMWCKDEVEFYRMVDGVVLCNQGA